MTTVIVLILIAVVAAAIVFVMLRNRRADSSVDSFRRHIDALGPEARRNTVDQVQTAAARDEGNGTAATEPPAGTQSDDDSGDDSGDQGGARGT